MLVESSLSKYAAPSYTSYTLNNFRDIPQIQKLSKEKQFEIEVVGNVLPFKTNNYVVEQLINWENIPYDPIFVLTFPQKEMLLPHHYEKMALALKQRLGKKEIQEVANSIRLQLNPHPAGQMEYNIPQLKDGTKLYGMQHKYKETVLFFPSQGQTCHAYCSFCFRWPQFVGIDKLKFAMHEIQLLVQYLKEHPEVSDILFTGGDPMIMKARLFRGYIDGLLEADLPNLKTIRIGTKALVYWPYKFLTDDDAQETLALFEKIVDEILLVDNAVRHVAIIDFEGNIMHKKIKENMQRLTGEMEDVAHAADLNIRKKMREMVNDSLGRTTFIYSIREKVHQLFFYTEYFQIYVTCERNLDKQSIMRISDIIESIIKKKISH